MSSQPVAMNFRIKPLLLIVLAGVVTMLAWLTGGFFKESEVCTHCGMIRHANRVLWIPFREIQPTDLSMYLNSLPGSDPQRHQWMFIAGRGGPIRCALGRGRELTRSAKSPEIVEALKSIRKHRGDDSAWKWTERILDPKSATDACMALYALSNPSEDFDSSYTMANEEFARAQDSHVH